MFDEPAIAAPASQEAPRLIVALPPARSYRASAICISPSTMPGGIGWMPAANP